MKGVRNPRARKEICGVTKARSLGPIKSKEFAGKPMAYLRPPTRLKMGFNRV